MVVTDTPPPRPGPAPGRDPRHDGPRGDEMDAIDHWLRMWSLVLGAGRRRILIRITYQDRTRHRERRAA